MVPRRRRARRSGADRRRGEDARRFRRAVPAGDRRQLSGPAPCRQHRRRPVRGARGAAARLHRGGRRRRRPSGGRRQPAAFRQSRSCRACRCGRCSGTCCRPRSIRGVNGMPRIAVEAVVAAPFGDVRVITTHLEWYSAGQRSAQVEALRAIYAEGHGHARAGTIVDDPAGRSTRTCGRRRRSLTGDFNLEPDDPLHARMLRAVRRRHAAALRRLGARASRHAPSGDVQGARKGNPGRARAALRLHLRERRPALARRATSASTAKRRRPTTSRSSSRSPEP